MSGVVNNLYDNISYSLGIHNKEMLRLQEETATGSRVNRVSDDASVAHRLMVLNSQASVTKNYVENLTDIINAFEMTSTTIQSMNDELTKVKQLLTQVAGGTYGPENRQRIADGIDDHLEQLVQLANSKHVNEYLFGGTKTATAPYAITRDSNNNITAVTYQGAEDERSVQTARGVNTDVFLVGTEVFNSNNRGTAEFVFENTNAALPTNGGTSSVTGDVWLTITENGASFDLSINGGTAVTLSDVGDASNVALTDTNGQVLYIDASSTNLQAGTDLLRVPGTYNTFDALIHARDVLRNTHSLADHDLHEAIQSSIKAITEVTDTVLQTEVSVGLTTGFLYDLQTNLENVQVNAETEADSLSQADVAQLAIDLSRRQVLYEMSLSVVGKLMNISLLNFIR